MNFAGLGLKPFGMWLFQEGTGSEWPANQRITTVGGFGLELHEM